jgi:hypothetical protein
VYVKDAISHEEQDERISRKRLEMADALEKYKGKLNWLAHGASGP